MTRATLAAPGALHIEILRRQERDESVAVLARAVPRPLDFAGSWIAAPATPEAYAHDLYANLRTLDAAGADEILIEAPPSDPAWFAVQDRLVRAAHRNDDDRD